MMKRDWRALMHYGVIFFLLEKFAAVVGTTNLHVYAAMRSPSRELVIKTRNTQVSYSVAGNDDSKKTWIRLSAKATFRWFCCILPLDSNEGGRCVTPDCGSRLRALLSVLRLLPPTPGRSRAPVASSRTAGGCCTTVSSKAGDSVAPAPAAAPRAAAAVPVPAPAARDPSSSGRGRCRRWRSLRWVTSAYSAGGRKGASPFKPAALDATIAA